MKIKYTDESGQLLIKCPLNKKFSKGLQITIYAGGIDCLKCEFYSKSKEKYNLNCKGV